MSEEDAEKTVEQSAAVTDAIWDDALEDEGEGVESDWVPRDEDEEEADERD